MLIGITQVLVLISPGMNDNFIGPNGYQGQQINQKKSPAQNTIAFGDEIDQTKT